MTTAAVLIEQARAQVLSTVEQAAVAVMRDHRRQQAARTCTGCAWVPVTRGRSDDPAVTKARHAEFNGHLARLIAARAAAASEGAST